MTHDRLFTIHHTEGPFYDLRLNGQLKLTAASINDCKAYILQFRGRKKPSAKQLKPL